jgi:hypothetical protein
MPSDREEDPVVLKEAYIFVGDNINLQFFINSSLYGLRQDYETKQDKITLKIINQNSVRFLFTNNLNEIQKLTISYNHNHFISEISDKRMSNFKIDYDFSEFLFNSDESREDHYICGAYNSTANYIKLMKDELNSKDIALSPFD